MRSGIVLCVALLIAIAGCESIPDSVDEGTTAAEIFKEAQNAYSLGQYDTALFYNRIVIERFGSQRTIRVVAEYEIAYIHFTQGRLQMAGDQFEQLITEYNLNTAGFPRWVYVLSEHLYAQITDQLLP